MYGSSVHQRSTDRGAALGALLQEVTRAANEAETLVGAARAALAAVCRMTGWPVGHLLVPDGEDFVSSGVWHLAGPRRFESLRRLTEGTRFRGGGGLVGAVRSSGRPAWAGDLSTDPLLVPSPYGHDIEVASAFAVPVVAHRGVVAILEFFSPDRAEPDDWLLDVMTDVGAQLARVVNRGEARRELQASKRRVERIIDTSAEAFISMSEAGTIVDWNAAAERMFGTGRAEAIGRSLADTVVPPRLRDAHRAGLARFLRTGERRVLDRRIEITAVDASGREFPVELAIWATPDGTRWTFSAFLRDISERRRADEERERLLAEQRVLLDSAVHGIYRLDADGTCTYANPAATRLLGWPAEQMVGSRIHALIHRHPPETECQVEVARRTGRPVHVDEELLWRADGTSFPAEYSCAPVVADGAGAGVVVSFTDVSARRRAEESLRAAYDHERAALAKLKELDDAKSNFLATVSHELRTPLTSLAGYLELFGEGDVGPVTDRQRKVLATMSRNADRLRALIEDLLTVSHVEARPLVLSPVDIDVADLLDQAVQLVRDAAGRRGHELVVTVDPTAGRVRVDPAQFRRVLTSLIDNAIKCTPPGGRVEVTARAADGGVRIAVHDNGIGIDPDEVPRLFTRFFRTSAATQLAIQGAGLSLAIARQIVDGHGGVIEVDTEPGSGTTFTVSLPA